ncbi:MAG TPA: TonB-dependent receptor [Chryseolinea sp.]
MKMLLIVLLITIAFAGFSQVKVSGTVKDHHGASIPGANVFLMDTYDGASSAADGAFEFTSTETGKHLLVVKYIGYKDFEQEINLDGKDLYLRVIMEETINELDAVMITAGAFTASDASRRTIFNAVDIATTAGATADIAGALNTLPGTQKVGEQGRLFVRGGDGNETRTFIDGMMVLDAYSVSAPNTPSRGRFLPFMFKGTSFSTGGYSAEYGQALSSALVLDSKDRSEATRTDIGILSVGGDVAHTQAWKTGSAAAKIQYTNIKPYFGLINQEIDWKEPPVSTEAVASFRQQAGENGLFKLYGNFSHAHFSMYNHSIDDYSKKYLYDLTNEYAYVNTSYRTTLNDHWTLRGGASYTFLKNNTLVDVDQIDEVEKGLHAKVVVDGSLSDKVELKTGGEVIQRNYSYENIGSVKIEPAGFVESIIAGFAEADLYTSNKFVTRVGARLEYDNLIEKVSVDPRLSLAYKTGESGQVSLAYGTFRQSPKNEWLRNDKGLDPERAEHFILNYQLVENNRTFRMETYYKRYDDLVKFADGTPVYFNQQGKGYAKGIELFWRDNRSIRNVDYWVSYSYLDTQRDYLDFPQSATPTFASTHNFSLVYKHFIQLIKCQLGFTYSFASGRPYNDPNTENFNGAKTPYYSDLSMNVAYLPKPFLIVYLSCTNLTGRDNIFGYEYSRTRDDNGVYQSRPIRQAAPRFLFVGIFITLSKDKSISQLPTL